MGKLTKEIKDEIVRLAVKETSDRREKRLAKQMKELAKEVYSDMYTEEEFKLLLSLPESWTRRITSKRVYYMPSTYVYLEFSPAIRVANDVYDNSYYVKSAPLNNKLSKFSKAKDKLKIQVRELEQEIYFLLKPITTTKRLLEVWPESTKYYQEDKIVNLPAINCDAVRKRMEELQAIEEDEQL